MEVSIIAGGDGGGGRSGEIICIVAEVVQIDGAAFGTIGRPDSQVGNSIPMGGERAVEVKIFSLPLEDGGGRRVAIAGGESGAGVPRRDGNGSGSGVDGINRALGGVFRAAQIFFDDYFVAQVEAGGGGR